MSTRGAYGFIANGQKKITYNHSDSYPDWLGKQIAEFIKNHTLGQMKQFANAIVMVDNGIAMPTEEQIQQCIDLEWCDLSVSDRTTHDWYCLLRGTQGHLDELYKRWKEGYTPFMLEYSDFLDSSCCEYVYVLNLDENTLEFTPRRQDTITIPITTSRTVGSIVQWMDKYAYRK